MMLGDLGAEVVKVEHLGGEQTRKSPPFVEGQSVYFAVYNRGKKSICIDLKNEEGKKVFLDLVRESDIVIENFRPGVMERMGLGYEDLCRVKPDIIFVRVSGFGQKGRYRERHGFDQVGQAMSGLMMLTGQAEGKPIATAFSLVDRTTALHAVIGAMGALRYRESTGRGQVVDVSLLDTAYTMTEIPTSYYLSTGEEGAEGGRRPYQTADGWVVVTSATQEMQQRIFSMLKEKGSEGIEPFGSLTMPSHPIHKLLEGWCKQHSTDEVCRVMWSMGVATAPILTTPQVARDPNLLEREALVKIKNVDGAEMYVPGLCIKFSESTGKIGPAPTTGQHTEEVLRDVAHYDSATIARLIKGGVVESR